MGSDAEAVTMDRNPAVTCSRCGFGWNSAAMAEGLRLLGSCPKCSGELVFDSGAPAPLTAQRTRPAAPDAPHLVLGIPRR